VIGTFGRSLCKRSAPNSGKREELVAGRHSSWKRERSPKKDITRDHMYCSASRKRIRKITPLRKKEKSETCREECSLNGKWLGVKRKRWYDKKEISHRKWRQARKGFREEEEES